MCKYMYVYIEQIFPKSIHWERLGRGNIPLSSQILDSESKEIWQM